MEGLRFRRSRLQCPALLLLATRRSSEGYKDRSIGKAIAYASCAERCLIGMEIDEFVYRRRALCFSFPTFQRAEAARFGGRVEAQDPTGVLETWCQRRGWHTFRHSVGTMLAEMGEHQLTIRDYLRHANLHVTNKYLQATPKARGLAQDKLVDAILPAGRWSGNKKNSGSISVQFFPVGAVWLDAYCPLISPDLSGAFLVTY